VSAVRAAGDGVVVAVWVTPGTRRTEVLGCADDRVRIRLAAPAAEGRANDLLVRTLAERLHVAPGAVSLIAGGRSRRKLVRVAGIGLAEACERLDL
jgi:uncharacterized protein (TIGR00251 family)